MDVLAIKFSPTHCWVQRYFSNLRILAEVPFSCASWHKDAIKSQRKAKNTKCIMCFHYSLIKVQLWHEILHQRSDCTSLHQGNICAAIHSKTQQFPFENLDQMVSHNVGSKIFLTMLSNYFFTTQKCLEPSVCN